VLSDGRTYSDGGALGAAPTRGLTTKTERLTSHNGTTGTYATVSEGTFDGYARPLTAKDAKGVVSRFAYFETNGLTTKKQEFSPKISVKNATAAEFSSTTEYLPAWGLTTVQKDWNDKVTTSAYDKLGRLTQVLTPDRAVSGLPTMKYTYITDPGKPVVVRTEKPDVEPSRTQVDYQIFDGFMRPRQVQAPGPNGGRLVSDTWYNAIGNVERTSEPYFAAGAASGALLPTEHADTDQETGFVYDGAGRVKHTITFSKGKELWRSSTAYEGDRAHLTPPQGGTATTSISDARGRMVQLWHYQGGTPTGSHDTTFYDYTPGGQLEKVTDPDGNSWTTKYDQIGRKVSSTDPDSGSTTYTYDEVDRLTSTQDARGRKIQTEYDDLGRVTGTFEVVGSARTQLTKNVYDSLSKGQPYSSTRYVNGQEYTSATIAVDNLYRPLRSIYSIPADAGTNLAGVYYFNSSYNADGTQQGFTYPLTKGQAAEPIVYTYDNLKRVTGITGATSYVTDVKYTDTGEVTQAQLDTGKRKAWVTLDYETSTKRLQKLMFKRESYVSSQNPVPDRPSSDIYQEYKYDQAGNIDAIIDTPGSGERDVQCFTYDHLRRMTDAYSTSGENCASTTVGGIAPYRASYEYDDTGNRLKETIHGATGVTRDYTYPDAGSAQPHAVQSITEKLSTGASKLFAYKYDKAGNTTERTEAGSTQKLDWDAEGKLSTVTNADGKKTSYIYSSGGDRLIRKEPGFTTLYMPGMELRLNTTSGVVEDTRFIALAGGAVAVRTSKGVQFQVSDANGTGQAGVDATTGAITMRRTTPFGGDRGAAPAAGAWYGEKGFVGGTKDSTTGLTHLGAREYDPKTGKFISVDPVLDVTDPQQMNGYAYANNSPVTFTDPSGLKFCSDDYCGPGADWVDPTGKYHEEEGHNDGRGGQSGAVDPTVNDPDNALPAPVRKAKKEHKQVKKEILATAKVLGKIIADELGITDAVDCFTKGDIGGCVNTAINVVMTVIGGAAGKLIARYALKIDKLASVVGTLWRLGNRMKSLVGKFFSTKKTLASAENATDALAGHFDSISGGATCLNSFRPETLVLLSNGSVKRIKDLAVGDEVVATDPESGETAGKEVVATHVNNDKEFTDLQVKSAKGEISELHTTFNHPFWSLTERAWVDAVDLELGDRLASNDGSALTVERTKSYVGYRAMYNLTIADIHTYYVLAGEVPVLVHNDGGKARPRTPTPPAGVIERIKQIQAGGVEPRPNKDYTGPDRFEGRVTTPDAHKRKWGPSAPGAGDGALIYDLGDSTNPTRILQNRHGDFGWVKDHNYQNIHVYKPC
jgi:RHS repeat-associated protein